MIEIKEYNKAIEEGKKVCFFCGKNGHARKHKIFVHNYQKFYWVCRPCLEIRGVGNVVQELEKIPLEQNETNFFKNKESENL